MAAFVDNDGNLLGGSYVWRAAIPELGISDVELLGSGSVLDVLYTDSDIYDWGTIGPILSIHALIELDYIHPALGDIGPLVLWLPYNFVTWPGCGNEPGDCEPWSTSISLQAAWSASVWRYFDRAILVPEPGTLALLGIGLFGMGLSRRKKV